MKTSHRRIRHILRRVVSEYRGAAFTAALIVVTAVVFIYAAGGASDNIGRSSHEVLEGAIKRAAVQCYAVEGFYPPDIGYLVDNYGLIIDEKKFFVTYSTFAANVFPEIMIFDN